MSHRTINIIMKCTLNVFKLLLSPRDLLICDSKLYFLLMEKHVATVNETDTNIADSGKYRVQLNSEKYTYWRGRQSAPQYATKD